MQVPLRYLESTLRQTARDFRKADSACDRCLHVWKSKCLSDIWNRRFDKLPVISAKLTLHVADADTSRKADAFLISELASSISEIASSADVACDKCGQIWKRRLVVVYEQAQLLRKLAPL
ncbi:hypothetical protein EV1_040334 [Malus domestica]